jgi:hypothetical protein
MQMKGEIPQEILVKFSWSNIIQIPSVVTELLPATEYGRTGRC